MKRGTYYDARRAREEMTVKERPILFSAPMVRAILDGQKTQTRRVFRGEIDAPEFTSGLACLYTRDAYLAAECRPDGVWFSMPGWAQGPWPYAHGAPGDRLWVRETWGPWRCTSAENDEHEPVLAPLDGSWARELAENGRPSIEYRATSESVGPWKPAIHMPRWASRILLEVTDVRVERLQAITEEDAIAEGAEPISIRFIDAGPGFSMNGHPVMAAGGGGLSAREVFGDLWDSIYGNWESNPWVWVVSFKRAESAARAA